VNPLFCSFFTAGSGYQTEAAQLAVTLDTFGLPHDIRPMLCLGSWQANTQLKSRFIADMLREYPGRPLVWLDADARVRAAPVLFQTLDCDFAAHWRDDPAYPHGELLSGTLYFSGSEASVELVDDWIDECRRSPGVWDQVCLDRVIQKLSGIKVCRLPAGYTLIYDTMRHLGPPVIEHMQASRSLRF